MAGNKPRGRQRKVVCGVRGRGCFHFSTEKQTDVKVDLGASIFFFLFAFFCLTNKTPRLQIIILNTYKDSELSSGYREAQNLIHRLREYLLSIYYFCNFEQDAIWKNIYIIYFIIWYQLICKSGIQMNLFTK